MRGPCAMKSGRLRLWHVWPGQKLHTIYKHDCDTLRPAYSKICCGDLLDVCYLTGCILGMGGAFPSLSAVCSSEP